MKKIVTFLIILLIPFNSYAIDEWSKSDIALQLTASFLIGADWKGTRHTSTSSQFYEKYNSFMGENPTRQDVDNYFIPIAIGQIVVAHYLPEKYRKAFLMLVIGYEYHWVQHNYSIGIRFNF